MKLTKYITSLYMDNLEFMRSCNDNQFDWAICDPNYGIGASSPTKKNKICKQKNGSYLGIAQTQYHSKDWDNSTPPIEYFTEVKRISRNQIIWGANYYDYNLKGGRLVWDKLNGVNDQYGCELAYLSFTNRTDIVYYLWSGMMQGEKVSKDVRIAIKQQGNKKLNEKRIHQTQKPVILMKWILDQYVKEGETVYDSHGGSLSLGIACHLRGLEFTATKNDLDHYNDSKNRVLNLFDRKTLFAN